MIWGKGALDILSYYYVSILGDGTWRLKVTMGLVVF